MSLSRRLVPQAAFAQPAAPCCHGGAVNTVLQPPPLAANCLNSSREGRPLSFHTVSLLRVPFSLSVSEVPPTATTEASDAGTSGSSGAGRDSLIQSQLR